MDFRNTRLLSVAPSRQESSYRTTYLTSGQLRTNQVNYLTEEELNEEIQRKLECGNVDAPSCPVYYSFLHGEYHKAAPAGPVVNLLRHESSAILSSSPEALASENYVEQGGQQGIAVEEPSGGQKESIGADNAESDNSPADINYSNTKSQQRGGKIRNSYNFYSRAVQATYKTFRGAEIPFDPPKRGKLSGSVDASTIFDNRAPAAQRSIKNLVNDGGETYLSNEKIAIFKMVERAVCLNVFSAVNDDFRYFEDPADEYRITGNLLPLWQLAVPNMMIPVSALEWSSQFSDLLAISFGSTKEFNIYDTQGAVALFSLKNPLWPEFIRYTEIPVLCVSLHPVKNSLMAVGFSDGHVAVYDCTLQDKTPQFMSEKQTRHTRAVHSLRWHPNESLQLLSISADGCVKSWEIKSTRMDATVVRIIDINLPKLSDLAGATPCIRGDGLAVKFHPVDHDSFLIGTAEGFVVMCSANQKLGYDAHYNAHYLPVNSISFNYFLRNIFLSCSPDGTVKIWEDGRRKPLFVFDLGNPVLDAEWAPYTSSIFAAITNDGYVHVYDLSINYHTCVHKQQVISTKGDNQPLLLRFNKKHPILSIADGRGVITVLKLSPNLRRPAKATKKDVGDQLELEIKKLEKVLKIAGPKSIVPPFDNETNLR